MKNITINTEYIKLGQLLKVVGVITNGSEAKFFLEENIVYVNDEPEQRRGRKIYPGYKVVIGKDTLFIQNDQN